MKRIIYPIIVLLAVLPVASCKKEMMGYEGMEGIYFAVQSGPSYGSESTWPYRPYTNIEFVRFPGSIQEYTANIKVMITGSLKDYDRSFSVEINPDSTTAVEGVDYQPLSGNHVIPANEIMSYIPITLIRTPDLETETKKIGLRLVPNEHFGLAFPDWKAIPGLGTTSLGADTAFDASVHTIYMNDLMVQPEVWYGSVRADKTEAGSWGAFTRKKLELMCELFDLTYADFTSSTTMPMVLSSLITTQMSRYLIDMFNAGTPVLEDDGRLMYMGAVPWTSIIGVPYI